MKNAGWQVFRERGQVRSDGPFHPPGRLHKPAWQGAWGWESTRRQLAILSRFTEGRTAMTALPRFVKFFIFAEGNFPSVPVALSRAGPVNPGHGRQEDGGNAQVEAVFREHVDE
ncbi:MAG: hypothetical protein ACLPXB_16550 [Thiobacillaceae bacterium]